MGVRAPGTESWDTNSITPGPEFMERLSGALRRLCEARGPGWMVSGAEEPGEGEQKVMAWVRARADSLRGKSIAVYGLDADLIVLCLLHAATVAPETTWRILREKQEFGAMNAARTYEHQEFLYLSVSGLLEEFVPPARRAQTPQYMLDYVCGMSLLGNDFLPHALSVHLREGGHDRLRVALEEVYASGDTLTERTVEGRVVVRRTGLLRILTSWSLTEDEDIRHTFQRKTQVRMGAPRTETERLMLPVQNLPLEWAEELALWNPVTRKLYPDWQERYGMNGSDVPLTPEDIEQRAIRYVEGLQWILDYYTGQRPVSAEWHYPWNLPPLWLQIAAAILAYPPGQLPIPPSAETDPAPLKPQEQLSMVLPLESWWLVRDISLRTAPERLRAFWPKRFGFHSLGRRFLWECEPKLPCLTARRLRWQA